MVNEVYRYNVDGRMFIVEHIRKNYWEGYFSEDHSITYDGKTRKEVLQEAGIE